MKEQTMKKLITLMMTFLLCLGSVAPALQQIRKKDIMPQPNMPSLSKLILAKFYTKRCNHLYGDWLYYQASNSLYGL